MAEREHTQAPGQSFAGAEHQPYSEGLHADNNTQMYSAHLLSDTELKTELGQLEHESLAGGLRPDQVERLHELRHESGLRGQQDKLIESTKGANLDRNWGQGAASRMGLGKGPAWGSQAHQKNVDGAINLAVFGGLAANALAPGAVAAAMALPPVAMGAAIAAGGAAIVMAARGMMNRSTGTRMPHPDRMGDLTKASGRISRSVGRTMARLGHKYLKGHKQDYARLKNVEKEIQKHERNWSQEQKSIAKEGQDLAKQHGGYSQVPAADRQRLEQRYDKALTAYGQDLSKLRNEQRQIVDNIRLRDGVNIQRAGRMHEHAQAQGRTGAHWFHREQDKDQAAGQGPEKAGPERTGQDRGAWEAGPARDQKELPHQQPRTYDMGRGWDGAWEAQPGRDLKELGSSMMYAGQGRDLKALEQGRGQEQEKAGQEKGEGQIQAQEKGPDQDRRSSGSYQIISQEETAQRQAEAVRQQDQGHER